MQIINTKTAISFDSSFIKNGIFLTCRQQIEIKVGNGVSENACVSFLENYKKTKAVSQS